MKTDNSTGSEAARTLPTGQDLSLPWHLQLPGDLEKQFRDFFRETTRRVVLSSFYLVMLLFVCGSILESLIITEVFAETWRPRLLIAIALAAVYTVARHPDYHRLLQPAMVLAALVLAITHDYMAQLVDHHLYYFYFYVNALAVLLLGTLFRVLLFWAVPAVAVILVAEAVTLFLFSDAPAADITGILFYTVTVAVMSLFGQYFFERLQRRHFLSERVLSLHRTELHTANRALETEATEDGLTGTVNRRGLETRLDALFHARRRGAPDAPRRISMLLFDIDFFKQYNDTYGHQAGDECLQRVAGIPRDMVQSETDFVARYGGEEFMVVLVDTTLQDALVIADRMRMRIEQLGIPHAGSRVSDVVTISVGVAATDSPCEAEELVRQVDEALYQAKEGGRNRVAARDDSGRIRFL